MVDAHANFAVSTVATAPSPATSGVSLIVATGDGTLYPTAPFNATVGPAGVLLTKLNSEIVRVTGIATDTLTIVRSQEGTSARTILVGDVIAATITAKTITDVEPSIVSITSGATLASTPSLIVALVGASGAPVLPTAVGNFSVYQIKNIDTTNKTVATTSSQTIDGSAAPITIIPNQSIGIVSDGSNWRII